MALAIGCEACGARFRVSEKYAGRSVRCPKCSAPLLIGPPAAEKPDTKAAAAAPAATRNASPAERSSSGIKRPTPKKQAATPKLTADRLAASLEGSIKPVRASLLYRLGILGATAMMIAVPLVYLTLIAAFGYGLYYHAVNNTEMFTSVRGRGASWAFFAYAAPLVAGPILLFFMLKPFLSRPKGDRASRSVTRENEPTLFAFVDLICEAVRAPRPQRIDIDCQLNASASFRRGWSSFFGNDLVLTVGMPMVAGLSLREFGGVLAHEFGHFSQGAGMRLTYVLRSLSAWLTRVVYERDAWDEWLAKSARAMDLRLGAVLYLAIFLVWITRKILWVLLTMSMAVVGYVLRQMEYDADRYEARFAGSDAFESTSRKLAQLSAAMRVSHDQLGAAHEEGRLPDNLPVLTTLNAKRLPEETATVIAACLADAKTGWFDTHPTDRDRIANARREDAPGVFRLTGGADRLFSDFEAQCHAATWEFYRQALGKDLSRDLLQPVAAVHAEEAAKADRYEALGRFSQGVWRVKRRFRWPRDVMAPPESPARAAEQLAAARKRFVAGLDDQLQTLATLDELDDRHARAVAYDALHEAAVATSPDLDDAYKTRKACEQSRRQAVALLAKTGEALLAQETALMERLSLALRLASHDALTSRLPEGAKTGERTGELLSVLRAIDNELETLNELHLQRIVVGPLVSVASEGEPSAELMARLSRVAETTHPLMQKLRASLATIAYPFPHRDGELTLADYFLPAVPPPGHLADLAPSLQRLSDAMREVQARALSELCETAESVEKALKMPPLPRSPADGEDAAA